MRYFSVTLFNVDLEKTDPTSQTHTYRPTVTSLWWVSVVIRQSIVWLPDNARRWCTATSTATSTVNAFSFQRASVTQVTIVNTLFPFIKLFISLRIAEVSLPWSNEQCWEHEVYRVSAELYYTGMFHFGDTSCRTLIVVCVCLSVCLSVCLPVCVSVCPPTYR